MDPGLEAYKKGRYILLAFKEECWWYNFTDNWNAQIVSKTATKFLRKDRQKWKIKSLFKALSFTIALNMECHFFMYSLLRCFENLLTCRNGTAALV